MANHETGIEWTHQDAHGYRGATWNPLGAFDKETGRRGWFCTHVSEGCRHCYAEKLNVEQRFEYGTGHEYKHQNLDKIDFRLVGLDTPICKTKPRAFFVNSMTDLFHPEIPRWMIDRIVAVMALSPRHRFMTLTKRPEEMLDWFSDNDVKREMKLITEGGMVDDEWKKVPPGDELDVSPRRDFLWPPDNLWLGVSAENQKWARKRIPKLAKLHPEITTFVSAEPLIGPIDFTETAWKLGGENKDPIDLMSMLDILDWVIVGGESGKEARPMDADWARDIRDQCEAAGVPYFFKQGSQDNWESHKKEETFPDDLLIREFPNP